MLLTTRYTFPFELSKNPLLLHPAILRVNRQINEEATNVLHGDNFWIIAQINVRQWPKADAIFPFVSRKDPSHIKYPALHVKLDLPCETTATESTTLIMGVESLPFFLHELRRNSATGGSLKAAGLTLRLCSSPFHSQPKLQSTCLEPFTLVRGFGKYSVTGEPDPMWTWYREDIMSRATSPFKDAGFIKGIAMEYLAQGDDAYFLGNRIMACAYYEIGRVFLKHASESLLAYTRTQPQYPHAQRASENLEIQTARGVLMAHSLRPLVVMGRHSSIITAGRSWIFGPQFLPKVEQVGVMVCRALSYTVLGDSKETMVLIVDACKLEFTNSDFVQVLLDICPGPLRESVRVDKFVATISKMKDECDERRCKRKREDESTGT